MAELEVRLQGVRDAELRVSGDTGLESQLCRRKEDCEFSATEGE